MSDSTASSGRFGRYAVRDVLGRRRIRRTVFTGFDEASGTSPIKIYHSPRDASRVGKDVGNYT